MTRRVCLLALVAVLLGAVSATAAPPRISARNAFLVQPDTRDVVYARAPGERRPMASTTKLMTALLTLERRKLGRLVTAAPYSPVGPESVVGLRAGERLTTADLLRALLLPSANDAAATLAIDIAGSRSRFVALMNRRAGQLRLDDTHYANPIGLDEAGGYSSARDLVELALILRRDPFFRKTVDRPRALLRSGSHRRVVVNRNDLVGRVGFVDGVKTGHTLGAGYVLVGSAPPRRRDGAQRGDRAIRRSGRATPTASRCCATGCRATAASMPYGPAAGSGRSRSPIRATTGSSCWPAARRTWSLSAASACASGSSTCPRRSRARCPPERGSGPPRCCAAAGPRPVCRW